MSVMHSTGVLKKQKMLSLGHSGVFSGLLLRVFNCKYLSHHKDFITD